MKTVISIGVSITIATILGVYGQGLAYYMSEHMADIHPIYYLTAFTVMSMLLYVASFVLAHLLLKKKKKNEGKVIAAFFVISIFAVPISVFSFFVTVMWWG
ncbi:hypothetical protein [Sporosarcina obsidiansis]|uniref:hypothetical protein n=1 Tax=Sporosarcina obsidiansis TaxID=2660748 RepID=UPI00129B4B1C|nr:hypothetical protein [Sporosarcina obsidiansis]